LRGRKIQKTVTLEEKRRLNHGDWCTSPTKFHKSVGKGACSWSRAV